MTWEHRIEDLELEPSVYAADFWRLGEQLDAVLDAGARVLHFDVGDGYFIDEVTLGPIVLQSISERVHQRGGMLDCHLMVAEPARHLAQIRAAGGDSATFHIEAGGDPAATVARARALGLGVGVACNPETPTEQVLAASESADLVLCMSIHPGLSGQELMPEALDRAARLRELLPESVSLQVDGGIHLGNVAAVRETGANLLVAGSGVFWEDDPGAAYRDLVAAARDVSTATDAREASFR